MNTKNNGLPQTPPGGNSGKKNGKNPKKPRFNIYWVYAIIGIILIGMQFFNFSGSAKQISFQQFKSKILNSHDVDKLRIIVNKNGVSKVDVFIKQSKLNEAKYKDVAKGNFNSTNPGPHFQIKIGSVESFNKKLDQAAKEAGYTKDIPEFYAQENNWFGGILQFLLPIIIIIAIWILLMRKMGGGAK